MKIRGKTQSEQTFEEFCCRRGIKFNQIAEGKDPTPDYDIFLSRNKVVVEVKEFDLNKKEVFAQQEYLKTGFLFGSETPGDRVRKKISEAGPQIRQRTKHRFPGLLILFDRGFGFNHLDPYSIRVAMYGLDTFQLAVPRDARKEPYIQRAKSGPKQKMTADDNTSISAIGVLYYANRAVIELTVYHNVHAAIPLALSSYEGTGIRQYRLGSADEGEICQWEEIKAGKLLYPNKAEY